MNKMKDLRFYISRWAQSFDFLYFVQDKEPAVINLRLLISVYNYIVFPFILSLPLPQT